MKLTQKEQKISKLLINIKRVDNIYLACFLFGPEQQDGQKKLKSVLDGKLSLTTKQKKNLFLEIGLTEKGTALHPTTLHTWYCPSITNIDAIKHLFRYLKLSPELTNIFLGKSEQNFSTPFPTELLDLIKIQSIDTKIILEVPYGHVDHFIKRLGISSAKNFFISTYDMASLYRKHCINAIYSPSSPAKNISIDITPCNRIFEIASDVLLKDHYSYAALHTVIFTDNLIWNHSSKTKSPPVVIKLSSPENHPRPVTLFITMNISSSDSFANLSIIKNKMLATAPSIQFYLLNGIKIKAATAKKLLTSPPCFTQSNFSSYSIITKSLSDLGVNTRIFPSSPTDVVAFSKLNSPNA